MSAYPLAPLSVDKRAPATIAVTRRAPRKRASAVRRGLGMLAALSLAGGPAAAQAADAAAAPIDLGRLALAIGVLSAIALVKIWAYADKRGKLMNRLTGYLTARAAHRSRQASARGPAHAGATQAQTSACPQQPLRSCAGTQATTAPSQPAVPRGARPARGFRVLPVPGLPSHMQYLSN